MPANSFDRSFDSAQPPFDFGPFVIYWREQMPAFAEGLYQDVIQNLPTYAALPREEVIGLIHRKSALWHDLLETHDPAPMLTRTRTAGGAWVNAHTPLKELVATNDLFRARVWQLARAFYPPDAWPVEAMEEVEHWMRLDRNEAIAMYSDVLQEAWNKISEREQILEQQRQMIQELSAPIVSIYAGIALIPLVGQIDEHRAMEILEATLVRIVELQAEILILDITGVPVIDTAVAHELLKLAQTVNLLGAQIILVGVSAQIAQTVIELGVDLQQLVIRADLQDGIRYALMSRGYAIHPIA